MGHAVGMSLDWIIPFWAKRRFVLADNAHSQVRSLPPLAVTEG